MLGLGGAPARCCWPCGQQAAALQGVSLTGGDCATCRRLPCMGRRASVRWAHKSQLRTRNPEVRRAPDSYATSDVRAHYARQVGRGL